VTHRSRSFALALGVSLLGGLGLVGCGGGDGALGCDLRANITPAQHTCVDYDHVPAGDVDRLGQSCERVSGGKWLGGPCDHQGALGGCRVSVPGAPPAVSETQWWWPGAAGGAISDRASAEDACKRLGGTFVTP
jgi:hypothetical protein